MTKEQFEQHLDNDTWTKDGEYKGVYNLKDTPIYTWYVEDGGDMAINWDFEYTVYKKATPERIRTLIETFTD